MVLTANDKVLTEAVWHAKGNALLIGSART